MQLNDSCDFSSQHETALHHAQCCNNRQLHSMQNESVACEGAHCCNNRQLHVMQNESVACNSACASQLQPCDTRASAHVRSTSDPPPRHADRSASPIPKHAACLDEEFKDNSPAAAVLHANGFNAAMYRVASSHRACCHAGKASSDNQQGH